MRETAHWLLNLCTAIGVAVMGTVGFFALVGLAALWQRRKGGFPASRRFH